MTVLGMSICISNKSMAKAMEKADELTPRGSHLPIEKSIEQINTWYGGWSSYFRMTEYPYQLKVIEAHIRRRLRARIVKQKKSRRNLYNFFAKQGVPKALAKYTVYSNSGTWRLSLNRAVHKAFSNDWFINRVGQKVMSDKRLTHWENIEKKPSLL